jgi:hypothetical protein
MVDCPRRSSVRYDVRRTCRKYPRQAEASAQCTDRTATTRPGKPRVPPPSQELYKGSIIESCRVVSCRVHFATRPSITHRRDSRLGWRSMQGQCRFTLQTYKSGRSLPIKCLFPTSRRHIFVVLVVLLVPPLVLALAFAAALQPDSTRPRFASFSPVLVLRRCQPFPRHHTVLLFPFLVSRSSLARRHWISLQPSSFPVTVALCCVSSTSFAIRRRLRK